MPDAGAERLEQWAARGWGARDRRGRGRGVGRKRVMVDHWAFLWELLPRFPTGFVGSYRVPLGGFKTGPSEGDHGPVAIWLKGCFGGGEKRGFPGSRYSYTAPNSQSSKPGTKPGQGRD